MSFLSLHDRVVREMLYFLTLAHPKSYLFSLAVTNLSRVKFYSNAPQEVSLQKENTQIFWHEQRAEYVFKTYKRFKIKIRDVIANENL